MPHLLLKDLPRYDCLLEAAKEFPDLEPTATEAYLHLLRTSDEAFGVTERNFTAHAISPGRFSVLMLLWRGANPADCGWPAPHTPAELADAAGVTRATMTGLIDTLERDSFVKRAPDPTDRRMVSVRLTARGQKFLDRFLPGHFRSVAAIMDRLSASERKTLVRLLAKVQAQAASLGEVPRGPAAV